MNHQICRISITFGNIKIHKIHICSGRRHRSDRSAFSLRLDLNVIFGRLLCHFIPDSRTHIFKQCRLARLQCKRSGTVRLKSFSVPQDIPIKDFLILFIKHSIFQPFRQFSIQLQYKGKFLIFRRIISFHGGFHLFFNVQIRCLIPAVFKYHSRYIFFGLYKHNHHPQAGTDQDTEHHYFYSKNSYSFHSIPTFPFGKFHGEPSTESFGLSI